MGHLELGVNRKPSLWLETDLLADSFGQVVKYSFDQVQFAFDVCKSSLAFCELVDELSLLADKLRLIVKQERNGFL